MSGAPAPTRSPPRLLPLDLRPMLARTASAPLLSPDYVYEVKWDGMRILAGVEGERWELRTRTGLEAAPRFPELRALTACARRPVIVDGEIVRIVEGRPSFWALQHRIQAGSPRVIRRLSELEPAAVVLFDLLRAGEQWLLDRPWWERRARLEDLVEPCETVQLSPVWPDGRALWETVEILGLEGMMAKRREGRYRPGRRTAEWLKIKTETTREFAVGGWTEGLGARAGLLGALLVGLPEGGRLRYVGRVGTGFDARALAEALPALRALEAASPPFDPAPSLPARVRWLRPELVCEVRHQGWSDEGRLRAPVFVRWRPDLEARALEEA